MLKADFHIHTFYSRCSDLRPSDLVKFSLVKGYDIVGVVDHNSIKGGLATKKIAGKKLFIIPGEEILTDKGEVIVFLSDGRYNRNLIDICERAKDMNHFIVIPHPFDFFRLASIRDNITHVKRIDAIETFNSRTMINEFNVLAKSYAEKNNIPKIAGSDAHFIGEIGNSSLLLDCDKNLDSIFDCIRKDKLKFDCKRSSILFHLESNIMLPIERLF